MIAATDCALFAPSNAAQAELLEETFSTEGQPNLRVFNPPSTLPMFRRNEVVVEVR